MTESKTCTKCGEVKPFSEFNKNKSKPDGLGSECRACAAVSFKDFITNRPFYQAVSNARRRAAEKGLPFGLTEEYLESIWTGVCPRVQVRLDLPSHGKHKSRATTSSLDRLVPAKGYVPGNVIWISAAANLIKSDAASADILAVGRWLQQIEEEIKKHETS